MHLLISLILALWVSVFAILSVQNATAVSLQFLFFRTIEIPLGVVLAFAMGAGLLGVALIQLFWRSTAPESSYAEEDEGWE